MRLHLLRHAKSSWDDPGLADHDRPLAKRGRRAAKAIAGYVSEHDIAPRLVLCSTARRTRETLAGIESALGDPEVSYEDELYGASARELTERLRQVPDEVGSVMLIGHNPGIEDLAAALIGRPVAEKYPTAALATLELSGRWRDAGSGGAELVDFVVPRDLEA
jgi:phosphohistidine phosphatase